MSTVVNVPINDMCIPGIEAGANPWSSIDRERILDPITYDNTFYCKLSSIASSYNTKIIERASLKMSLRAGKYIYGESVLTKTMGLNVWGIKESWDASTIRIGLLPSTQYNPDDTYRYMYGRLVSLSEFLETFTVREGLFLLDYEVSRNKLRELITYGFYFQWDKNWEAPAYSDTQYPAFISKGTNLPTLQLTISDDDNTLSVGSCSPTSGFRAKYSANTYTWSAIEDNFSAYAPTVASSKFRWRTDSSATATEIDCGTTLSYTMPANTVSTSSFQWQAEITDSTGHTATSDWFTISTSEATSTATIVEPKNITIDGSSANTFEWIHNITTGTAQTQADLQYSTDGGTTWTQFATPTGSATSTIIAADTFSAGSYLWRVRTYNTDSTAGSWSDSKPFTVIAKPHVYAVSAEQNPKPKISWQMDTQQAYRVYIEDVFDSGSIFGTATSYELPVYLDDGNYIVYVEIQNNFGLWSSPGSAPINVSNTPGTSMTLIALEESTGIKLTWTSVLSYAYYIVYRDDIAIKKTRDNEFKDLTSIGSHEYFIRGIYASSKNYGISNKLTVDVSVNELMIINLETENSMSIEQNDSAYAELYITDAVKNTSIYISAADYPINEVSHYKSKTIKFDCAFVKNSSEATDFRSMLGCLVCIKTPSGTSVIGNLLEQTRTENYFYEKYSCYLSQTHNDEEIQL